MGENTQNKDIAAGLDIPVAEWERAKSLIDCIIVSNSAAKILRDELSNALEAQPVPLARVNELERRMDRRRVTHKELITSLNDTFMTLALHLERAGC